MILRMMGTSVEPSNSVSMTDIFGVGGERGNRTGVRERRGMSKIKAVIRERRIEGLKYGRITVQRRALNNRGKGHGSILRGIRMH